MKFPTYPSTAKAIFLTGLLAGTLDILAAFLQTYLSTGRNPGIVLKYIASGVWGSDAFAGGTLMVIYGLVFHYTIAFGWTTLYFLSYPRLKFQPSKYLAGIVYGIFVWSMMNFLIVPLSKVPQAAISWKSALQGCLIIILAVGMPIAISAGRFYSNQDRAQKAA